MLITSNIVQKYLWAECVMHNKQIKRTSKKKKKVFIKRIYMIDSALYASPSIL